jgi:predicted DNA binding CopG/RHH family protein
MNNFDPEEKEILEALEMGKLERPENAEREIAEHRKTAEATFRKNASIPIHIAPKDLRALQVRAMRKGVSYPPSFPACCTNTWMGSSSRK